MKKTNGFSETFPIEEIFAIIVGILIVLLLAIIFSKLKWLFIPISEEKKAQLKEYIYDLKNNRIGLNTVEPPVNPQFKSYRTIQDWIFLEDHSDFRLVSDSTYFEFYFQPIKNMMVPNERYFGLVAFLVVYYDNLKFKLSDPVFTHTIINFYSSKSHHSYEKSNYTENFKKYRNIFLRNEDVSTLSGNQIVDCISFLNTYLDYVSKIEKGYVSDHDYNERNSFSRNNTNPFSQNNTNPFNQNNTNPFNQNDGPFGSSNFTFKISRN